jgi:hypothetical protein
VRHQYLLPEYLAEEIAKPTKSIAAAGAVAMAPRITTLVSASVGATNSKRELVVIELVVFHVGLLCGANHFADMPHRRETLAPALLPREQKNPPVLTGGL